MQLIQYMYATDDRNGNPRRLFVIYEIKVESCVAEIVTVGDEGHGNRPHIGADAVWLPAVSITAAEYRAWHARLRPAKQRQS